MEAGGGRAGGAVPRVPLCMCQGNIGYLAGSRMPMGESCFLQALEGVSFTHCHHCEFRWDRVWRRKNPQYSLVPRTQLAVTEETGLLVALG